MLKRAAERGVRVLVMVYKEVTASMTLGSKHTKVYRSIMSTETFR